VRPKPNLTPTPKPHPNRPSTPPRTPTPPPHRIASQELSEDSDADVRFYAAQALYGVDRESMMVA